MFIPNFSYIPFFKGGRLETDIISKNTKPSKSEFPSPILTYGWLEDFLLFEGGVSFPVSVEIDTEDSLGGMDESGSAMKEESSKSDSTLSTSSSFRDLEMLDIGSIEVWFILICCSQAFANVFESASASSGS